MRMAARGARRSARRIKKDRSRPKGLLGVGESIYRILARAGRTRRPRRPSAERERETRPAATRREERSQRTETGNRRKHIIIPNALAPRRALAEPYRRRSRSKEMQRRASRVCVAEIREPRLGTGHPCSCCTLKVTEQTSQLFCLHLSSADPTSSSHARLAAGAPPPTPRPPRPRSISQTFY